MTRRESPGKKAFRRNAQPATERCRVKGVGVSPASILQRKIGICIYECTACALCVPFHSTIRNINTITKGRYLLSDWWLILFVPYDGQLFCFAADLFTFQCKHHIRGTLKETDIAPPARAALTMEQADELLLHFAPAVRADSFTSSHKFPHKNAWVFLKSLYIFHNKDATPSHKFRASRTNQKFILISHSSMCLFCKSVTIIMVCFIFLSPCHCAL